MTELVAILKERVDLWRGVALLLLFAGFQAQIQLLLACWEHGGHMWMQGDWLISLAAGPIRRGPFGQGLLFISDSFDISPLALVIAIQVVLVLIIFLGFARLLYLQTDRVMVLVVFTAGCFAIFWTVDPSAALHKELIAMAALIWLAQPNGGMARLVGTGLLMVLGGIGHEVTVLLLPAWILCVWLFQPETLRHPVARIFIAVVFIAALIEAGYALTYRRLADATLVCDALTSRGLSADSLCGGAIKWLADLDNGPMKVWYAIHHSRTIWLLPLAWGLAFAPLWRIWKLTRTKDSPPGWLIVGATVPIFLLYPVGYDWGRWFSIQLFIVSTIFLGLGLRQKLQQKQSVNPRELSFWFVSSLAWGVHHAPIVVGPLFFARIASFY